MRTFNFSPFPILEGNSIILREPKKSDASEILTLRGNAIAMELVPRPLMKTMEEAYTFLEILDTKLKTGEGINWAITEKGKDTLIGNICHFNFSLEDNRSEVGYMLHPDYFQKGYMTEALHLVLQYGFNVMQLHSSEAIILEENIASRKVAEKVGMKHIGTMRESCFHHNTYHNQFIYDLLASEYE